MKRVAFTALAVSFALSTAAQAGITVTLANGNDGTFNGNPLGSYTGTSTAVYDGAPGPISFSAGADSSGVTMGTTSAAAQPLGDGTHYLWGLHDATTVTFTNGPVHSFLIHWGSVDGTNAGGDAYDNLLTLSNGDSITGAYLTTLGFGISGNGSQTDSKNNPWLLITDTDSFSSFTATSPNNSFEFDMSDAKLTRGVPEPSTWAMMLIGFGALGVTTRAKRRQRSVSA
jgi:hypothetical protein